jgi:transmembrane sensor
MLQDEDEIRQTEALAWHIRLREGSAADWEEFTDWLEQSAGNSAAYDAIVLADEKMDAALALASAGPSNINDNDVDSAPPRSRPLYRRPAFGLTAVAAVMLAGVFAYPMMSSDNARYAVETGAGIQRSVRLADGTRIDLNGDTRILLDRGQPRLASLEQGEATFTVTHDPANPFVVKSGNDRIQDVGTIFNVARDGDRLSLSVAEGSVVYNPDGEAVQLTAGNTLRVSADQDTVVVGSISPQAVASWRQGRLVYDQATIGAIASDLSRSLGTQVTVAPDVAGRAFTGVIMIDKDQPAFFRRLEGLLDLQARRSANGWRLTSRTRAHS